MDLRLESEDKDRKLVNIYRNILKINSIYYFCFYYGHSLRTTNYLFLYSDIFI